MKDNQSEHNMGEQIMGALSDALQGGDYSTLNRLVSQSVVSALNEVGKHISFMDYGETQNKEPQNQTQKLQGKGVVVQEAAVRTSGLTHKGYQRIPTL